MTKQMLVDVGIPFLPEEIIANILKRIPVKSLIRFQCVCKQWKNLFQTPSFIADHLPHHRHDDTPSLLLQSNHRADSLKLCLVDEENRVREFQNPPLIDSLRDANVIGSSNGLLCVEFDEFGMSPLSLLLWNPATREVRKIPRTLKYFKGKCILGFGHCQIINDYKIVRVYEFGLEVKRVEVYSLNTDSWKKIKFENLKGIRLLHETIAVNGTMFWHGSENLIVSFDITKEEFRLIPMPLRYPQARTVLTVYENKLAMFSINATYGAPLLWVMKEGTGACKEGWSWTKKYYIPLYSGSEKVWRDDIIYNFNIEIVPRLRKLIGSELIHEAEDGGLSDVLFTSYVNPNEVATCKCGHGPHIFNHVESLALVGRHKS
ncbi:F-box protein At3g07870-like isoform X2 [Neltuma alba]|uniref:F-box protein At3g07870-like isoform X1 n=1 Tax=Neltuma alba TaxID=207710 RepID=UPI0010A33FE6|nr:F-box protein At3g07870-like isoform X1 [Prosopis alba]XP_028785352.1 F-box protein At3g07870-like isoform X2 [Prosopis alba]